MRLSSEAGVYLLPPERPVQKWIPDEYDVTFADIVKPYQNLESADVGLVGIPFDTNVMQRPGSKFGPSGVREKLVNSCTYEVALDVDLSEGITVAEFGDIDVVRTKPVETERRVIEVLTAIHRTGTMPIVLGGDHSLAFPCIKALCNVVEGPIGVLIFDSHLDVRISLHGEMNSGVAFRRMFFECDGKVSGKNVAELGINGWFQTKMYREFTKEQGMTIFTARDFHLRGPNAVVAEALEIAANQTEAIFCTVDIDCCDPSAAPGTCSPSPGGLTSFELLEFVFMVGQHPKVRHFDVMEVSPPLDVAQITAYTGAAVVTQFIGGVKKRKQGENS